LGWTCIGAVEGEQENIRTNFVRTYFVAGQTDFNEVNSTLCRFWEIDNSGAKNIPALTVEDKAILDKAQQCIYKVCDGHYRIAILWKEDKISLPNNYSVALCQLQNLEKRLEKSS